MIKRGRKSLVAFAFIIWGALVAAEPPTPVASEQEFWEFLGGWELEDGTWVNPLEFLGPDDEQISDETVKDRPYYQKLDNADHDTPIPTQAPELTPQP